MRMVGGRRERREGVAKCRRWACDSIGGLGAQRGKGAKRKTRGTWKFGRPGKESNGLMHSCAIRPHCAFGGGGGGHDLTAVVVMSLNGCVCAER